MDLNDLNGRVGIRIFNTYFSVTHLGPWADALLWGALLFGSAKENPSVDIFEAYVMAFYTGITILVHPHAYDATGTGHLLQFIEYPWICGLFSAYLQCVK